MSALPRHCATSAGRLSTKPLCTRRAASQSESLGRSSRPLNLLERLEMLDAKSDIGLFLTHYGRPARARSETWRCTGFIAAASGTFGESGGKGDLRTRWRGVPGVIVRSNWSRP